MNAQIGLKKISVPLRSGGFITLKDSLGIIHACNKPNGKFPVNAFEKLLQNVPSAKRMGGAERSALENAVFSEAKRLLVETPIGKKELGGLRSRFKATLLDRAFGLLLGLQLTQTVIEAMNGPGLIMLIADKLQPAVAAILALLLLWPRKRAVNSEPIGRFAQEIASRIDSKLGEHGSSNGNSASVPTQN